MSAVPDVLDAMVARWSRLGNLQVENGPSSRDLTRDALLVGFTPEDSPLAAAEQTADLRGARDQESFVVASVIRCWTGGDDVAALTRRAYAHLAAIRADLRRDTTLDGAVARARFAAHSLARYRNDQGQLVVDLIFQVAVDTWI